MAVRAGILAGGTVENDLIAALSGAAVDIVMKGNTAEDAGQVEQRLRLARPDVLFLDIVPIQASLDQAVRGIAQLPGRPVIIGVCSASEPEIILRAFRAGISEMLLPPFTGAAAQQALDRVAIKKQNEAPKAAGRAVAFLAPAGGCGATTVACHAAAEIGRLSGRPVLIADFDLCTGQVALWMKAEKQYSVLDCANNLQRLDSHYWKGIVSRTHDQVDSLAAPDLPPISELPRVEAFGDVLAFAREKYECVVADLGAGVCRLSLTLAQAADITCVVTTLAVPALYQARRTVRTLIDYGVARDRLRLICNRIGAEAHLRPDEAARILNVPIEAELPDDREGIEEALAAGILMPPKSEFRKRISQFASAFTGVTEAPRESRFASLRGMFAARAVAR